ncbi:MAG: T9SS type A sorting domain-containing protein [Bacteroidetes bacterium]|nr:T9SS type A sorting domain-containing protein [Bacteroidota bacterium]
MKRILYLMLQLAAWELSAQTNACQNCYGDKGISTNPENPQNCELSEAYPPGLVNPFLNKWNWAASSNGQFLLIPLNPQAGWLVPDFYNPSAPLNMRSPFYDGFLQKPAGTPIADFDFHWQDGWELLWRNTGYLPNGQQYQAGNSNSIVNAPLVLHNARTPYFVLYNRYNGKMRLFFNVFADLGTYNHVNLDIGYLDLDQNEHASGLFRHGDAYDRPLDQRTIIKKQSAHFENINNINKWFMTEVQTGYDPCVCDYFSEFNLKLWGINSSSLDLTGRSISATVPLRDGNGQPTYRDFLNINTQQENGKGSGFAVYKTLDGMLTDYDKELKEYKDKLADYNSVGNAAMRSLMGLAKEGLNAGLTGLVPSSILAGLSQNAVRVIYKYTKPKDFNNAKQWFIDQNSPNPFKLASFSSKPEGAAAYQSMLKDAEKYSQELSKTLKGGLGALSDNLFATFYTAPEKPTPPTMPVATLTEMKIVGTLDKRERVLVGDLYTPGSFNPAKYSPGVTPASIDFNAFPIYNEALGLFAMLETPKVKAYQNKQVNYLNYGDRDQDGSFDEFDEWKAYKQYYKLAQPLRYRFNHGIDFDFDKTEIHGQYNIKLSCNSSIQFKYENLKILHNRIVGGIRYLELVSDWYPVEILGEMFVGFSGESMFYGGKLWNDHEINIESVKLKLMNDMYFKQLSHDGKEINTTQVLTYLLYERDMESEAAGVNHLLLESSQNAVQKYNATDLLLENEMIDPNDDFVFEVSGNIIYIKQNSVNLKGAISVAPGYSVVIQAYWEIITEPDCVLEPEIVLEIKRDFYNFPQTVEVTDAELAEFCKGLDKKYKANEIEASVQPEPDSSIQTVSSRRSKPGIEVTLQPNPSNNLAALKVFAVDAGATYSIFDMQGNLIEKGSITLSQGMGYVDIFTAALSNGLYIVSVGVGNQTVAKKLMVIHD